MKNLLIVCLISIGFIGIAKSATMADKKKLKWAKDQYKREIASLQKNCKSIKINIDLDSIIKINKDISRSEISTYAALIYQCLDNFCNYAKANDGLADVQKKLKTVKVRYGKGTKFELKGSEFLYETAGAKGKENASALKKGCLDFLKSKF